MSDKASIPLFKSPETVNTVQEEIAKCFMDFAAESRYNRYVDDYPRRYLDWITLTAGCFFEKHPDLLTDEVIQLIATGEASKKIEQYGHIREFYPLNEALENYCSSLRPSPKKSYFFGLLRL
jgi:hypothetical protein